MATDLEVTSDPNIGQIHLTPSLFNNLCSIPRIQRIRKCSSATSVSADVWTVCFMSNAEYELSPRTHLTLLL